MPQSSRERAALSNRNHRKTVAAQLQHGAAQREREMALRRIFAM